MESIGPKKTLVEQTYDILVDAICSGELQPGERLTQDEIAARLDVSRQPVNSAISILKANGFVEDTGRRGVVVAAIDPAQFRSIYEFRAVIEPFAVRLAGERMPSGAADEAEEILARGRRALRAGDTGALVRADVDFHEMIYRWGGNHVIESSMRLNWQHMRRGMVEVLRVTGAAMAIWDDHERIASALLAGDIPTAQAAITEHIGRARERTLSTLSSAPAAATSH